MKILSSIKDKPESKYWLSLVISIVLYFCSFLFPVLIDNGHVRMTGIEAFTLSFQALRLLPIGFIFPLMLAPSNPLLYLTWYLIGIESTMIKLISILCVVSMILCGLYQHLMSQGDMFHGPSGTLGIGYYLWLSSGIITLYPAFKPNT